MEEWSKKIGEYGENLVEKVLSVVGRTDLQKGIEIKCSNEEHTKYKRQALENAWNRFFVFIHESSC